MRLHSSLSNKQFSSGKTSKSVLIITFMVLNKMVKSDYVDTQQSAIKIAREFITAIIASGFPLKKAILFGSYARNEQRKDSDIDLALIADEFIGVGFFDLKHFVDVKISKKKYTPIEVHTFNTAYFQSGDPFIREIEQTGVSL